MNSDPSDEKSIEQQSDLNRDKAFKKNSLVSKMRQEHPIQPLEKLDEGILDSGAQISFSQSVERVLRERHEIIQNEIQMEYEHEDLELSRFAKAGRLTQVRKTSLNKKVSLRMSSQSDVFVNELPYERDREFSFLNKAVPQSSIYD